MASSPTVVQRGLEEDLRRLKEATERQQQAKDNLIKSQIETIQYLRNQREALLDEREQNKILLDHMQNSKSENIELLQAKISHLEANVAKQDAIIERLEKYHIDHDVKQDYSPGYQSRVQRNRNAPSHFDQNNHQFQDINDRYTRIEQEMERLKSFYGSELEKEKIAVNRLLNENQELKSLVTQLLEQMRQNNTNNNPNVNTARSSTNQPSLAEQLLLFDDEEEQISNQPDHLPKHSNSNPNDYRNHDVPMSTDPRVLDLQNELKHTHKKLNIMKLKYIDLKDRYRKQCKKNSELEAVLKHVQTQIQEEEAHLQALSSLTSGQSKSNQRPAKHQSWANGSGKTVFADEKTFAQYLARSPHFHADDQPNSRSNEQKDHKETHHKSEPVKRNK